MSKNDKDTKIKTPEQYVHDIQEACAHLGWCIAMDDSKKEISGLVIGNLDYVNKLLKQIINGEEYDIWAKSSKTSEELH